MKSTDAELRGIPTTTPLDFETVVSLCLFVGLCTILPYSLLALARYTTLPCKLATHEPQSKSDVKLPRV